MKKQRAYSNDGRSFVEMLGVLAIAGMLSIGSFFGIRLALAKHQANLITGDVMLQAQFVLSQNNLTEGDFLTPDFQTESGKSLSSAIYADGFDVRVPDVNKSVCERLLKMQKDPVLDILINNDPQITTCPDIGQLFFLFALPTNESDACTPACNSCETCRDGECVVDPKIQLCRTQTGEEGYCMDGTCLRCPNQSTDLLCGPCERKHTDSNGCPECIPLQDGDACLTLGGSPGTCQGSVCTCAATEYTFDDKCYPCPDHAVCDGIDFICDENYKINSTNDGCEELDGSTCASQADCNSQPGYYCELSSYAPGASYCEPEITGTGTCKKADGSVIIARNGQKFFVSHSDYLFYWSAKNFCQSKGLTLATINEACPGWDGTEGTDGACQNFDGVTQASVMGWTQTNANDCAKYYVYLNSGKVGHKPYFYSNLQALCMDDGRYSCASDQYLDGEFCTDCPPNATCDGVDFVCNEGYWLNEETNTCDALEGKACSAQSDCGSNVGYYCLYTDYPGNSYCSATVAGNGTCEKASGTRITGKNEQTYLLSDEAYMYYWSAKNFCESNGMHLASMAEACPDWTNEEGKENACPNLTGKSDSSVMGWTDTNANNCAKHYVFLDSGKVGHKAYYYTNLRALCVP